MANTVNTINNYNQVRTKTAEQGLFDAIRTQKKLGAKKAKGVLVNNKDTFGNMVYDAKAGVKDFKNIGKALVKGEADDYDLGRINDVGLKLGGLAIASTLAMSKYTTATKLMELIGVGTFFATMKLWPKVMIHKPLEKKYGFNINQKYINSQGKKKDFFQDNQYLPWDLWDKKEINKIGNYMGVDKNMPDREEFIQRKMQKVALQGNTLNLMTAGLATPIMTALICRALEKPLEKAVVSAKLHHSAYQMENFDREVERLTRSRRFDASNRREYEELIEAYRKADPSKLDSTFATKYARVTNPTGELAKVLNPKNRLYDPTISETDVKIALERFKKVPSELADKEGLIKTFKAEITKAYPDAPKEVLDGIEDVVKKSYDFDDLGWKMIHKLADLEDEGIIRRAKKGKPDIYSIVTDVLNGAKIRTSEEILADLTNGGRVYADQKQGRAIIRVLEKFGYNLAGEASESHYTLVNKKFIEDVFREISPSLKELKGLENPDTAVQTLTRTFSQVAENAGPEGRRGTLEYFIKKVGEDILSIRTPYDAQIEKFDAKTLMDEAVDPIVRKEVENYGRLTKGIITRNREMTEARGIRLILTADVEKRLKGANLSDEVKAAVRKVLYETSGGFELDREDGIMRQALEFIFRGKTDEKVTEELARTGGASLVDMFENYKGRFGNSVLEGSGRLTELFGTDLKRLVKNSSASMYKSKLWLRVFGIAAIGIVAVTSVAQKFFGNMKKEEKEFLAKKGGLNG